MAYVAPSTVTTLQTYTSSAHNIIVNDIIDLNTRATVTDPFGSSWTSYTPTIGSGWTKGDGTTSGAYLRVGSLVVFYAKFVIGNGTKGTGLGISLPIANAETAYEQIIGNCIFNYVGVDTYLGTAIADGTYAYAKYSVPDTTRIVPRDVTSTAPFTFRANDTVAVHGAYRCAP